MGKKLELHIVEDEEQLKELLHLEKHKLNLENS